MLRGEMVTVLQRVSERCSGCLVVRQDGSVPLATQFVEFVGCVCARHRASEFGKDVVFSLENHATDAVGVGHDTIADLEPRCAQRIRRDRDLMLGTDPRCSTATVLYLCHESKGTQRWVMTQSTSGPSQWRASRCNASFQRQNS